MSFLNEIRSRINSVKSTRQITSAMKLVASSKLHKNQNLIDKYYQYQQALFRILYDFMEYETREKKPLDSIFFVQRKIEKVAIVAVSSNMSLCGAFNEEINKELISTMENYSSLGWKNVTVIPIGSKIANKTSDYPNVYDNNFEKLVKNVSFDEIAKLSDRLVKQFYNGEVDKIEFIYHHCKSITVQNLVHENYLPINLETLKSMLDESIKPNDNDNKYMINYIFEPDAKSLLNILLPKLIRLKFYTMLLDSVAAEHSARMVAMQIATDNADNLLQSLSVQYNKQRQQAITNELLDIIGGSIQ